MGGKSGGQITGYWYPWSFHFVLGRGKVDALLEFRGGDRTAWSGRAEGQQNIEIDARELWGGEQAEGGIDGTLEWLPGGDDQAVSGVLQAYMNPDQPNYGWVCGAVFTGLWGALNPYPKSPAFWVSRILEGWDDDVCWYPEKAPVPITPDSASDASVAYTDDWSYQVEAPSSPADYSAIDYDHSGWLIGPGGFGTAFTSFGTKTVGTPVTAEAGKAIWLRRRFTNISGEVVIWSYHDDGCSIYWNGVLVGSHPGLGATMVTIDAADVLSENVLAVKVTDAVPSGFNIFNGVDVTATAQTFGLKAMNPAHILYDAITSADMQGDPISLIDEASFTAAADLFYDEGFGLATVYDPASETVEQFRQRICNVVGASLSRSRTDGKWYLIPIRGVHDIESLPILEDDDILEFEEEPSDPNEAVNQYFVDWFDPIRKEKRTTQPLHALGAIQAAGGIISETAQYPEIPYEDLALRVAARDLRQKSTPLKRFSLTTNRKPYNWRQGQYFRLQAPRRGIADMVCMVGEIDAGTPRSGSIKLVAIQDVSSMPDSVYVEPQPGIDPADNTAEPNDGALFEVPYMTLAGTMTRSALSALEDDAGFLGTVAERAGDGISYAIYTAADGETLTDRGTGQWCPTATVTGAFDDKFETGFTLENMVDVSIVEVGTAAMWGNDPNDAEIVRIDAINATTGAVTFGRGCGDAVPRVHADDERIWFFDGWAGSDQREYVDGEEVDAKLATRTETELLNLAEAPLLSLTMDSRAVRPYPPAHLRLNGNPYDAFLSGTFTVSWVHRNRVTQADQIVDNEAANIDPESNTRYGLRFLRADTEAVLVSRTDLGGPSATVTLTYTGEVILELWAIRDVGESWQRHRHTFDYSSPGSSNVIDGPEWVRSPDGVIVDGNDPPPDETPEGPDPEDGGTSGTGTEPTLTIGAATEDPCAYGAHPTASASTNSTAFNAAFAALPGGGGTVEPSIAGTYQINTANPIAPVSNSRLRVAIGKALKAAYSSTVTTPSTHRDLIRVDGVHDVSIEVARATGYRTEWAANGGVSGSPTAHGVSEWAHGVYITNGSTDINVIDFSFDKFVGDGISVGRSASQVYIGRFNITNCRRQGISNGGDNVTIEDGVISYIGGADGTSPMAGIDNEVDGPESNSSINQIVRRVRVHHCTGPAFLSYKSCNDSIYEDVIGEYCSKGVYGVDSDNVTFQETAPGLTKLRYNKYEGAHIRGSSSNWDFDVAFFANKTKQYGIPTGTNTTTSPTAMQKAKHVTIESSVTGVTYDASTTWGPV